MTGRDQDVLVVCGLCDDHHAARLVGSDGRVGDVNVSCSGLKGSLCLLAECRNNAIIMWLWTGGLPTELGLLSHAQSMYLDGNALIGIVTQCLTHQNAQGTHSTLYLFGRPCSD